jgi:hypothetical protein
MFHLLPQELPRTVPPDIGGGESPSDGHQHSIIEDHRIGPSALPVQHEPRMDCKAYGDEPIASVTTSVSPFKVEAHQLGVFVYRDAPAAIRFRPRRRRVPRKRPVYPQFEVLDVVLGNHVVQTRVSDLPMATALPRSQVLPRS